MTLLMVEGKAEHMKHKISGCKEIIKIRTEIDEMETKRTIQRINETKRIGTRKDKQNWQNLH
jgi:hypothetical protein